SQLAQKLKAIAGLVHADLGTRIYYVQLDGFDTHSQQAGAHSGLLRQWTGAVAAFLKDLESHQLDDRVTVMSFSEFGRRLEENASEGTDHGAAAPLFLAGKQLNSGLIGELPSLTDLDQGDLKFQIDFRQVYASLLEDWLGCDSPRILGKDYKKIPVFHKT
ncbi:MAG: DUF1501 domain-containing protein, partial [Planctomycetaceae bacterium]|nr:DUF1501 domain-containing protein [Planctomycetaceae bacterium]